MIYDMEKVRIFEDLEVWQRSHSLVVSLYKITKDFPKEELYGITSQIRRSGVSIPNNIAEGFGRYTTKDLIHFLIQSGGSLHELKYLVMLSHDLDYINPVQKKKVIIEINEIGMMLNGLINSLRKRLSITNH